MSDAAGHQKPRLVGLLDERRQRHQQVGLRVGLLLLHPRHHLTGAGLDEVDRDAGVLGELVELGLVPVRQAVGAVDRDRLTDAEPDEPVPPQAAVMVAAAAITAIAAARKIVV